MTKDKKQSVSRFTEEQLTPLEQKFAEAKANRDAGVEPYVMVPVELWVSLKKFVSRTASIESELLFDKMEIIDGKMKQL